LLQCFWSQGGAAELADTLYRGLGIAVDVDRTHASDINSSGVDLTLVTATFGPRYTWTAPAKSYAHDLQFFGQGLIGRANGRDSVFPTPYGAENKAYSFAW
jgi:hypothetical protein